jgi:ankyrin repeat protein
MSNSVHIACSNNDIENIKKLIENGKDVNSYNINGNTPLHEACINGHTNVIKFLISNGAKINATNYYSKDTPLHKAVQYNHIDSVKILLETNADIHNIDVCRKSALYTAYYNKRIDIANLLIEKGAYLSSNEIKFLKSLS